MKTPSHITTYAVRDRPIAAGAPNCFRSETFAAERNKSIVAGAAGCNSCQANGLQPGGIPRGKRSEIGVS